MALDAGLVGRSYPPSAVYEVGRAKIAEFAAAVGATDAAHTDAGAARALGHPDVVAPPTFAIVVTLGAADVVLADPEVALDYSRVVHGDQKFAYTRPVVAGDALVCVNSVDEITSRGGHDFLTTRTEVTTADGEPVVTVWSKLVQRGEH